MRNLLSFLFLVVCLCSRQPAFAQSNRLDSALDRYEQICDRCIQLRDRSLRGEQISPEELRSLLEQVSSLRATLQEGTVDMTAAQRRRFETIRSKYTAAFLPSAGSSQAARANDISSLPTVVWRPLTVVEAPSSQPELARMNTFTHSGAEVKGIARVPLNKYEHSPIQSKISLVALAGWMPEAMSYGAMVGYTAKRFGAYLKGRSNFVATAFGYGCLSDGTSGGHIIWTTGNESHKAWAAGGGAIVRVAGPLSIYAGTGYGKLSILWEDTAGKWAQVEDLSQQGICADAGLMFSAGMFTALVGVSTIKLKKPTVEVGLGVRF